MKPQSIKFIIFINIIAIGLIFQAAAFCLTLQDNPVEVGNVRWGRDLDEALQQSRQTGRPIILFFQEIPGCIGCQTFGSEVLTNPLLVEAIEDEFLPVLVYNNRMGGSDEALLQRFGEPAWNFQVIRFLDAQGRDIIPREDKIWTLAGVATRMIESLQAVGRTAPLYLQALALENDTVNHALAGFAMACFWTGEYKLGKIDGVVRTEAGWYDHREVTLVTYHKGVIGIDELVARAAGEQCAQRVYLPAGETIAESRLEKKVFKPDAYKVASPLDQKKQLEKWSWLLSLPGLTPMQKTKLNSLAPDDHAAALAWLSPRQRKILQDSE